MQNHRFFLAGNIYSEHLTTINGIGFTRREIDIIACLLNARRTNKIAALLSIAPRTVVTHTRNIMLKISCNSQDAIIDFMERSEKLHLIRKYYFSLLAHATFEKNLKDISKLNRNIDSSCVIISSKEEEHDSPLLPFLMTYLRLSGVHVAKEAREVSQLLMPLQNALNNHYVVYVVPQALLKELRRHEAKKTPPTPPSTDFSISTNTLFLLEGEQNEDSPQRLFGAKVIHYEEGENLYSLIFEILKHLLPTLEIEEIISEFKKKHKHPYDFSINDSPQKLLSLKPDPTNLKHLFNRMSLLPKRNKWSNLFVFLTIGFVGIGLVGFQTSKQEGKIKALELDQALPRNQKNALRTFTRSDLSLPTAATLVNRPELMAQIDDKFKGKGPIQTVALVGIGGVGKTVMARNYARHQKEPVIWEINAENKISLVTSFKYLANALAKSSAEKNELEFIHKIRDDTEKEKCILSFVMTCLKKSEGWFLIYDNVESFDSIKNYFPNDYERWGAGKVIITTQDQNIKNIGCIKDENVVELAELNKMQALSLFTKILFSPDAELISEDHKNKILHFLAYIPPFPLDISIAAYYIKMEYITYEQYLERLKTSNINFEKNQKNILKEISDYTKTRYNIISLSLKKVIEENPGFKGMFFVISLLDTHDIPKNFLEIYEDKSVVDSFIHALRKHSLLTTEGSITNKQRAFENSPRISSPFPPLQKALNSSSNPRDEPSNTYIFSMHGSTQEIGLAILAPLLTEGEKEDLIVKAVQHFRFSDEALTSPMSKMKLNLAIPHLEKMIKKLDKINLADAVRGKCKLELLLSLGYAHYEGSHNLLLAKEYFSHALSLPFSQLLEPSRLAFLFQILGDIYSTLGVLEKVIETCKKSINFYEKLPNAEMQIAENYKTIGGSLYRQTNNLKNAISYYEKALEKISSINQVSKFLLQAEIYAYLAVLHSANYLAQDKNLGAAKYAKKALEELKNSSSLPPEKLRSSSCAIGNIKMLLGHTYSRLGQYPEALQQYKEGWQLGFKTSHSSSDSGYCSHDLLLKARIYEGLGEIFLREGKLKEAEEKLTEAIHIFGGLLSEFSTLIARNLRAEARIRQEHLKKAYEDCLAISSTTKKETDNYKNLMYLTHFYHMAIIKYKEGNINESLKHFSAFQKYARSFCKAFFDVNTYKNLASKGLFIEVNSRKASSKISIQKYLKMSKEIFSAIYKPPHPFLLDYIWPNTEIHDFSQDRQ